MGGGGYYVFTVFLCVMSRTNIGIFFWFRIRNGFHEIWGGNDYHQEMVTFLAKLYQGQVSSMRQNIRIYVKPVIILVYNDVIVTKC